MFPKIGLVIVHGIGDPSPGEALRDLTDAMEASGIASFDAVVQERRLNDTFGRDEKLKFFPVHLRTGTLRGEMPREVIAAEVFWGSASQLAPGRWGVLQGAVSLLLNVPTLVMGARGEKNVVTELSWSGSMLMASAAFALNALLMLTLGAYIALCYIGGGIPTRSEALAPIAAAFAVLLASRHRWLWFKETCWAFRLAPLCLVPWLFTGRTLRSFSNLAVPILMIVIVVIVGLVLAAGVAFIARQVARRATPADVTATLAVCLQFGLWTLIVPLAWQALFALVPEGCEQPWMIEGFGKAARSNGLQWPLALLVLTSFAAVTVRRWLQARRAQKGIDDSKTAEAAHNARPADRLILHPIIATTLFVSVMAGALVVLLASVRPDWVARVHALASFFANPKLTGAALVVVPLLSGQLRLALDLAYDVMFYLYYATEPGRPVLSRTSGEIRSNNPMRSRFYAVVNHLAFEQKADELIILAHSQGTVIALDELAHSWAKETEKLPRISLVTFGSPITQLYQHYFPEFYPGWKDKHWSTFFSRLSAWTNLYRLDDYVGTVINPPPAFNGATLHQEAIGIGGHTNYWRDPRFLAALKRQMFPQLT